VFLKGTYIYIYIQTHDDLFSRDGSLISYMGHKFHEWVNNFFGFLKDEKDEKVSKMMKNDKKVKKGQKTSKKGSKSVKTTKKFLRGQNLPH